MPKTDRIFRRAGAEMGTIPNSPAHYLSALGGVDRSIRLSKDGMMEVEAVSLKGYQAFMFILCLIRVVSTVSRRARPQHKRYLGTCR